ncbi:MAG: aspartate/glutamate racemase family protein [Albidovulum sp.]|nr:aspartate/glutamate racemase family protein [Albidovulum sp.]MDE0305524.1 aspartate/glutamate racemase family protein [Albidovulum sp.]MDE0533427.1 aspartate/glutamate racemase family protein [Albidovulum sp.]
MTIGLFDSGLGGLTIYESVAQRIPHVPIAYLGDNENAPYGVRDADDIFRLTCSGVERLWDVGCCLVILACNTASAVALKRIQESWLPPDKRVLGVFVPMIEVLTERRWGDHSPPKEVKIKNVALFATPATVASRAFQRELASRAIGVDVEAQPCGGLVDAIEDDDYILAEALVHSHVEALLRRMPCPEAAVLACTHYPLFQAAFQDALGPNVKCISQANLVADSLADYLNRHPDMLGTSSASGFFTTGDARSVSLKAVRILRRKVEFESV